MKIYGYSLLVLALTTSLACSKGGDDNKGQPAVAPNNGLNLFGQPNTTFNQNFDSIDIVGGKIVSRQFNIAASSLGLTLNTRSGEGQISQEITGDSCKASLVGKRSTVTPGMPNTGNLSLRFDASGNLQIQYVSNSGTLTSEIIRPNTNKDQMIITNLNTYTLNDQDQSIEIGPFVLVGAPTTTHINYILRSRGLLNQAPLVVDERVMQQNNMGGGFRSDYTPGQPLNHIQQNQMNLNSVNQMNNNQQQVVSSGNRITSLFENGLKARIQTLRLNRQHVHAMFIDSAQDVTEAVISSQNAVCATNYSSTWRNITLK